MAKSELRKELDSLLVEIDTAKSDSRDVISRRFGISKDAAQDIIDRFLEGENFA